MIAKNFIRYPEALRFQREMFSNGYHNSPRIMRLVQVIFSWKPTIPQWVKDAKKRASDLVKHWQKDQILLNFFKTHSPNAYPCALKQEHRGPQVLTVQQASCQPTPRQ
jgi:hypothetical protein